VLPEHQKSLIFQFCTRFDLIQFIMYLKLPTTKEKGNQADNNLKLLHPL